MRKLRIILTKDGEVYATEHYSHETLISEHRIRGRDWRDYVRVVLDAEGNIAVKGHERLELPEWLERQYGTMRDRIRKHVRQNKQKG